MCGKGEGVGCACLQPLSLLEHGGVSGHHSSGVAPPGAAGLLPALAMGPQAQLEPVLALSAAVSRAARAVGKDVLQVEEGVELHLQHHTGPHLDLGGGGGGGLAATLLAASATGTYHHHCQHSQSHCHPREHGQLRGERVHVADSTHTSLQSWP